MSRLYELRTYALRLDQVRQFLQNTAELFHLRTKHSRVLGYWTSELGGLNEVVHVWEYDDLAHRASVRANMAEDPVWAEQYVRPVLNPAVVSQTNLLMKPIEGSSVQMPVETGVSELQQYSMRGPCSQWYSTVQALLKSQATTGSGSTLIGGFDTLVGPMSDVVLLWHHPSQDALLGNLEKLYSSPEYGRFREHVDRSCNKLLLPHKISPVQ